MNQLTRQGARRLAGLNPQLAFHDRMSPVAEKFPQIRLDQTRSVGESKSASVRKSLIREQDMKRYGKLGVSRTKPAGDQFADCEYISVHDLVFASESAQAPNTDAFFQQLSERLMRDADLLPVSDLLAILRQYAAHAYYDIGLLNKLKNEFVYDIDRLSVAETAEVIDLVTAKFNVVSPKLISVGMKRLVASMAEMDAGVAVTVMNALKNCPKSILISVLPGLKKIFAELSNDATSLPFADLVSGFDSVLMMQHKRGICLGSVEPIADAIVSHSAPTDIACAASALSLLSKMGDSWIRSHQSKIVELGIWTKQFAPTVVADSTTAAGEGGVEGLRVRNVSVKIAASIVSSKLVSDEVVQAFLPAITPQSVRGLGCRELLALTAVDSADVRSVVRDEVMRKRGSFSTRDRVKIDRFLREISG